MNAVDQRPARNEWLISGCIFLLALTVRLVFLLTSPDRGWPHSGFYEGDAPTWVEWAQSLQRGEPFEFGLPLRSPTVAYVMNWTATGAELNDFTALKIIWCVCSALTCALAYVAFRREFDRPISLTAAALCSFSFGAYIISTSLNNETIYLLALVLIVLVAERIRNKPSWLLAIVLGVLNGIALLTRFEHLAFLILLAAYLVLAPVPQLANAGVPRRACSAPAPLAGLMLVSALAVCLPWSIRGSLATQRFNTATTEPVDFRHANPPWTADAQASIESLPAFARSGNSRYISFLATQSGKNSVAAGDVEDFFRKQFGYIPEPLPNWTLLSLKGPVDFALANHPDAHGGFSKAALRREGDIDPAIMFGRPDHLQLFNHGYSIGWQFIRSDLGGWLKNVGRKLWNFSDGVTMGFTSRNLPLGWTGQRRPVDVFTASAHDKAGRNVMLMVWKVGLIALIGAGTAWCVANRRGQLWLLIIVYKLVITIFFYGYARQAVSIAPACFILMAVAVRMCAQRLVPRHAGIGRGATVVLPSIVLISVISFDIACSFMRPRLSVTGPVQRAPQWGSEAFQSMARILIAPANKEPAGHSD